MTREEAIEILRNYDDLVWQEANKVTMGMVADAVRMGEDALQSPWKSVKEELPKHLQSVFVCTACNNGSIKCVSTARYDDYYKEWICGDIAYPDYWMPIPELPKEDTK